jgi:acyl dehydratase
MDAPTTHRVEARNLSRASENRIHDDEVARRFGFAGALVPGVEVYAYACHLPVRRWGRAWLERGRIECRFLKPVYDGRIVTVTAAEEGRSLAFRVESEGVLCATGHAALDGTPATPPATEAFPHRSPPATRPPADEASLAPGTWLGTHVVPLSAEDTAAYLRDIGETDPLYATEGLGHPGQVLRLCNRALSHNVALGPWIHVGSAVRNLSVARIGDDLSARARVIANYEREGHRLVDLDVLVLANGATPLAHATHTAVYRPRQVAEAA